VAFFKNQTIKIVKKFLAKLQRRTNRFQKRGPISPFTNRVVTDPQKDTEKDISLARIKKFYPSPVLFKLARSLEPGI